MSLSITTIRTGAESIVATELGVAYKELPYQFDIHENDSRLLSAGYSIVWGAASETYFSPNQIVNMEQDIILQVTRRVYVRNDDDKIVSETDIVYNLLENIIKRFVMDKMDMSDIIQKVQLTSMDAPERIGSGRDIIALKLIFKVNYVLN